MKNYIENVLKTEGQIDDRLRDRLHQPENIRLLHSIIGIVSEVEELNYALSNNDRVNILEEISDVCWYSALACDVLHIPFPEFSDDLYQRDLDTEINLIINTSSKLADILKKTLFYGRESNKIDLELGIHNVIIACASVCKHFDSNIEKVKEKNIEKLRARYGEKFTESCANKRNLTKEYEVLSSV